MPDLVVRNIDESTIAWLEERARWQGRSLEDESRIILERAARQTAMITARNLAARMSGSLQGRTHSDSAGLLREDRNR